jgi:cytochrome c-type biogenesis protein
MLASLGFAFLAGTLTILSPCVLPLLPIVLGTAASQSKYGPLALGAGVVISFVTVGLFVALVGFSIGLDGGFFRSVAAAILVLIGLVMVSPVLQSRFAIVCGPVANWGHARLAGFNAAGTTGQFGVGLLLGTVWSPCVGPTLGATSLLAAQGKDLGHVVATMAAFAIGVGVPLVLIGLVSRSALQNMRGRMMAAGSGFKIALGLILVLLGGLILTGFDKAVETAVLDASPTWLTALTTRF